MCNSNLFRILDFSAKSKGKKITNQIWFCFGWWLLFLLCQSLEFEIWLYSTEYNQIIRKHKNLRWRCLVGVDVGFQEESFIKILVFLIFSYFYIVVSFKNTISNLIPLSHKELIVVYYRCNFYLNIISLIH